MQTRCPNTPPDACECLPETRPGASRPYSSVSPYDYLESLSIRKVNSTGEMAASDPTKLLDQLQTEVNRVVSPVVKSLFSTLISRFQLEQTARVFSAASKNSKTNSTAQASKLKSLLPESVYRFHDALDQLEDELVSMICSLLAEEQ